MSVIQAAQGYCFLCGKTFTEELSDHFAQDHQAATAAKPKVPVMPWKERLGNVVKAIEEILQGTDIDAQIQQLDTEVIQELYIVRARLNQLKRNAASRKKEKDAGN